jgi:hypothetical protein
MSATAMLNNPARKKIDITRRTLLVMEVTEVNFATIG